MNWLEIEVSADNKHFLFKGKPVFGKQFTEVLKFHSPGLAPVRDESGSYHIDASGKPLYDERYSRTFGYYCNRAAVVQDNEWFHQTEDGRRAYANVFSWTGNFQENLCTVRDYKNKYYHIDLDGNSVYADTFIYCGDFKDGYACVKRANGLYVHIDINGRPLNQREFFDLGVFHKNYATAKDQNGWHHIDRNGYEIYRERHLAVEPFYNGFALVTRFDNKKYIIDEKGRNVLML